MLQEFFATHPVFTSQDVVQFLSSQGRDNKWTYKALLAYHRHRNHIVQLRRGLYAAVPIGVSVEGFAADPFLVTSRMTPGAVLAYHTALEYHGRAHSIFQRFYYLAHRPSSIYRTISTEFVGVRFPAKLCHNGDEFYAVDSRNQRGLEVHVTSLERTLVDVLDRPDLSGGWEEIWRSLEQVEFFDLDKVLNYVLLLKDATTAAKVGYYLEQHRESLMVDDAYLEQLRRLRPARPHYMTRNLRGGRLVKEWNLIVPESVIGRTWGEVV